MMKPPLVHLARQTEAPDADSDEIETAPEGEVMLHRVVYQWSLLSMYVRDGLRACLPSNLAKLGSHGPKSRSIRC